MKQDDIFPGFATSLEVILKQGAQKLLQQNLYMSDAYSLFVMRIINFISKMNKYSDLLIPLFE